MSRNVMAYLILTLQASAVAASDELVDAVRCSEIGFSLSVEEKNLEAFSTYIASDARFVAGSILRGREEVVSGWRALFADTGPRLAWRPAIVEVLAMDGLALSRGPYRLESTTESGETTVAWGTFNSVWQRQANGAWQVLFDAGGDHGKTPSDAEIALFEQDIDCPEPVKAG
jgi:ketosteroid isomerase-like protein